MTKQYQTRQDLIRWWTPYKIKFSFFYTLIFVITVTGCTTAPLKEGSNGTNAKGGYYQDDGPDDAPPQNLEATPDAIPKEEPLNRFANRPYTVLGAEYTPDTGKKPYKERGIASWYGKKFKGKKTASGEPYDMYAMTAAHRTLPIPSYVKVTNVKNKRSVIVRVNDRGPFHSSRVIDLSYTAALKLGIISGGSALVEVERAFAETTPAKPSLDDSPLIAQTTIKSVADQDKTLSGHFIQLGAFGTQESAENLRTKLQKELSWLTEIIQIISKDGLYRVRLGPYPSKTEATTIADKIQNAFDIKPLVAAQ